MHILFSGYPSSPSAMATQPKVPRPSNDTGADGELSKSDCCRFTFLQKFWTSVMSIGLSRY